MIVRTFSGMREEEESNGKKEKQQDQVPVCEMSYLHLRLFMMVWFSPHYSEGPV